MNAALLRSPGLHRGYFRWGGWSWRSKHKREIIILLAQPADTSYLGAMPWYTLHTAYVQHHRPWTHRALSCCPPCPCAPRPLRHDPFRSLLRSHPPTSPSPTHPAHLCNGAAAAAPLSSKAMSNVGTGAWLHPPVSCRVLPPPHATLLGSFLEQKSNHATHLHSREEIGTREQGLRHAPEQLVRQRRASQANRAGAGRECWQSARKRLERFCGHRTRAAEQSVARDHGHGRGAHR